MTYPLTVLPEAEADIDEAYRWYEARLSGLGSEFMEEVGIALGAILDDPLRPRERARGMRRTNLRRFPFAAFYVVRNDHIL